MDYEKNESKNIKKIKGYVLSLNIAPLILFCLYFIDWINNKTLLQLCQQETIILYKLGYIIPLLVGLINYLGELILKKENSNNKRKYGALILLINFNLLFLFIWQIMDQHRFYIWNNAGIYLFLFAIALYFLGIISFLGENGTEK